MHDCMYMCKLSAASVLLFPVTVVATCVSANCFFSNYARQVVNVRRLILNHTEHELNKYTVIKHIWKLRGDHI